MVSLSEVRLDQLVEAVEQRRVRTKALRILETRQDSSKCLHCGSHGQVHRRPLGRAGAREGYRVQAMNNDHERLKGFGG